MGNGPRGKAGLASMETLDDSTKDPWNQENGSDAVDAEKPVEKPEKGAVDEEKKESLIATIQSYSCSIGKFVNHIAVYLFQLSILHFRRHSFNSRNPRVSSPCVANFGVHIPGKY